MNDLGVNGILDSYIEDDVHFFKELNRSDDMHG